MSETVSMSTCPMTEVCKGLMDKQAAGLWVIVPGVVFIILGVTIIIYPQVLVWLVAIALIVLGFAMLMMVNFMRNVGKRLRNTHR